MALAFLLYTLGVLALAKAFSLVYVATKTKATSPVGSGAKEAQRTKEAQADPEDFWTLKAVVAPLPHNPRQVHEGTSDLPEPTVLREFDRIAPFKGSAWPPPV